MKEIEFSSDQKNRLISKVKTYFNNELDHEIGGFEAEFLIEFFGKEIGSYYYNLGLLDAQKVFAEKMDEASYLIQEIEQPES
jgi:uncharacterized protein (DUF2164 family)